MKTTQRKSIAIHETENSKKVVRFLLEKRFTTDFIQLKENGLVEKCFLNENKDVLAKETSGVIHSNILI